MEFIEGTKKSIQLFFRSAQRCHKDRCISPLDETQCSHPEFVAARSDRDRDISFGGPQLYKIEHNIT